MSSAKGAILGKAYRCDLLRAGGARERIDRLDGEPIGALPMQSVDTASTGRGHRWRHYSDRAAGPRKTPQRLRRVAFDLPWAWRLTRNATTSSADEPALST